MSLDRQDELPRIIIFEIFSCLTVIQILSVSLYLYVVTSFVTLVPRYWYLTSDRKPGIRLQKV